MDLVLVKSVYFIHSSQGNSAKAQLYSPLPPLPPTTTTKQTETLAVSHISDLFFVFVCVWFFCVFLFVFVLVVFCSRTFRRGTLEQMDVSGYLVNPSTTDSSGTSLAARIIWQGKDELKLRGYHWTFLGRCA